MSLIDKHAPECHQKITVRPHAPWYTQELRDAKHQRRRAERVWRHTKLTVHQQIFKEKCALVNDILHRKKTELLL